MFTGLIEEQGIINKAIPKDGSLHIEVSCNEILQDIYIDSSIAVNGCCLTVTEYSKNSFSAIAIEETLRKTNLGYLKEGTVVNLERAVKHSDRLGGHLVQGHVDTVSELIEVRPESTGTSMIYSLPKDGGMLVVDRGSITIDGISLTVAEKTENAFRVAIIPHTWDNTNIRNHSIGYKANIEYDLTGKYIQKMIQPYLNQLIQTKS